MSTKNPLSWFSTRSTSQRDAIPGSTQVPNSAGGHAWLLDDWSRLRRFLILGVDGPSYYASERQLVKENADAVMRCFVPRGGTKRTEFTNQSAIGGSM